MYRGEESTPFNSPVTDRRKGATPGSQLSNLNIRDMKNKFVVSSGWWTASGNFQALTATGDEGRIHIPSRLMESAGFTIGEEVSFPLFVVAKIRHYEGGEIPQEDGSTRTVEAFDRLTASAVFTTREALTNAFVEGEMLERVVEVEIAKAKAAISKDLTEEQLAALQEVSLD